MNKVVKSITVDIADEYPSILRVIGHELNTNSFFIKVKLYENKQPVVLSEEDEATATLVTDGFLVVSERKCTISIPNEIEVDLSNEIGEPQILRSGKMVIEIAIKSDNESVFVLPKCCALIDFSEELHAQITPESYGTTAEILKEVAEARGGYNTLNERLDSTGTIPDGSITTQKLANKAVTTDKIDNLAVGTNQIAGGAVKSSKIALEAINPDHLSADTLALFNSKLNWQGFTSGLMFHSKGAFDVYEFEVGKVYSIYLSANVLYTGSDGLSALLIMPTTCL